MEKLKLISAFMLTKALRQLSNYCPTGRLSMKNLVCQKSFRLALFGTVWGIPLFPCAYELDFFSGSFIKAFHFLGKIIQQNTWML